MSEVTKQFWQCDQCKRTVQKTGLTVPSGWREVADGYGNTAHACDDANCQARLQVFLDNEVEVSCG